MSLDKDREVFKNELEKTTFSVEPTSDLEKEESFRKRKTVGVGIRTYAADIADIMRREKGSVIKIALAEQERRQAYKEKRDPTSTKNLIVILLGVIFIVAGILVFVYTILNRNTPTQIISVPVGAPSLIYSENQTLIDITKQTRGIFFNEINSRVSADYTANKTITNLFLIHEIATGKIQVTAPIFLNKLGVKIPDRVSQILSGQFMLGVYKSEDVGNLFMIIKTKDFNETFASMKEWEVSLVNDMVRLFQIDPKSFAGDIFTQDFVTNVSFNKQARTLYDKEGKFVFSYVYLDNNTILFTTHEPLVEEVIKRINSQSIK